MASLATRIELAVDESQASASRARNVVLTSCYRASGSIVCCSPSQPLPASSLMSTGTTNRDTR